MVATRVDISLVKERANVNRGKTGMVYKMKEDEGKKKKFHSKLSNLGMFYYKMPDFNK